MRQGDVGAGALLATASWPFMGAGPWLMVDGIGRGDKIRWGSTK